MALTTLAEYKAYRGITVTTWDTQLTVMLGVAQAQVRRLCGRNTTDGFESKERTETYDGTGTENVQLVEWPVTDVDSVSLVAGDDSTTTLDAGTDYRVDGGSGVLSRKYAVSGRFAGPRCCGDLSCSVSEPGWGTYPQWPQGVQNVSVTYTGGYSTIPEDLKYVVWKAIDMLVAGAGLAGSGGDASGMKSESIGDYSYTKMTPAEKDATLLGMLGPYITGGV